MVRVQIRTNYFATIGNASNCWKRCISSLSLHDLTSRRRCFVKSTPVFIRCLHSSGIERVLLGDSKLCNPPAVARSTRFFSTDPLPLFEVTHNEIDVVHDISKATCAENAMNRRNNNYVESLRNRNAIVKRFYTVSNNDKYSYSDKERASLDLLKAIKEQADDLNEFLVTTRRTLHRNPELMYQEEITSQTIQNILRDLGVTYSTGWGINRDPDVFPGPGGYGVVADIGTGEKPCVLLRADMDALPIMESTEGVDDFRSKFDNKMHACGHDGHTTMLLGAVAILKSIEDSIPGTVRVMFQPAEEGGAGAKRMREEGVLTKEPKPSYAFGMHVWPTLPSGSVASRSGPLMSASERFEILITGVGGHAAMPHLTIDPVVTASAIVMNLQTLVSRAISPLQSGVCSITQINTGSGAYNVIPHSAVMKGTIRSLSTETLLQLRDKVQHIVSTTADVHGCSVNVTFSPQYYPVTMNDPELYDNFSKHVGALVSNEGFTRDVEPTMGAEDFSFIADTVPATFFFLGSGSGSNPPTNYGLHHPRFALDERVLPRGVELHVNLALRAVQKLLNEKVENASI